MPLIKLNFVVAMVHATFSVAIVMVVATMIAKRNGAPAARNSNAVQLLLPVMLVPICHAVRGCSKALHKVLLLCPKLGSLNGRQMWSVSKVEI